MPLVILHVALDDAIEYILAQLTLDRSSIRHYLLSVNVKKNKTSKYFRKLGGYLILRSSRNQKRRASYVGCTIHLATQLHQHSNCIVRHKKYGEGATNHIQFCHSFIADCKMDVSFHVLATFSTSIYYLYKYLLESILMVMLGSIDRSKVATEVQHFFDTYEPQFLSQYEHTPLN